MTQALIRSDARVLILSSGMAGHEINCIGVAEALGAPYKKIVVAPRGLFGRLAPYGPIDPKDSPRRPGSILAPPFPDIVIACGRITVPYIRALKRAGGAEVFAVFLQDPRYARREFDLLWAPRHDGLAGPNVLSTLTSPHPFSAARLEALRKTPDPRLAALPVPRAAIILGGPSGAHGFTGADLERMTQATQRIVAQGYSVMATPSRRTPPELVAAVRKGFAGADPARGFLWDGGGENPYGAMLAQADAILVTGDSVNMMGEAVATGAPVYIFAPSGGGKRIDAFIAGLREAGAARLFEGPIEKFSYEPIDSSRIIAEAIAQKLGARK
jgi:uncharacterized protein